MGSAIQKVTNACSEYNNAAKSTIVNGNALATTIGKQNSVLGDYLKSLNGSQASMKGYIGYLAEAKIETLALQAGTVLLNAGISFLATLLISKAIGAWQKYKEGISSSADAAKQAATNFKETKDQLTEYAQAYQELGDNVDWDTTSTEKAKQLQELAGVTGMALTKLDGTAKGGIVIAVADSLQIPVKYIGVGEGMEDLMPFDARSFVDALI